MPFHLPVGYKFACIALENAGIERQLRDPIDLGDGRLILFEPPFPLAEPWRTWLGSIRAETMERVSLTLFVYAPSRIPTILDAENEALKQIVLTFCYAVFLVEVFHHDGGMILTGANVEGNVTVRQVSQLEPLYRPNGVLAEPLDRQALMDAARIADGMRIVHDGLGHHERLRKGFHAWIRGLMEYNGDERLHQFIRAVEAAVMPPKGKSTSVFAHRCQLFAGNTASNKALLGELYELRNTAEHHNTFAQVLTAYQPEHHEQTELRRTYQAQALASDVYRRIFLDPQLQASFATDTDIAAFWAMSWAQQTLAWGNPIDLEAKATARMPYPTS